MSDKSEQTPDIGRLPKFIQETRKARGYTQEQCARRAGIPLSTWATQEAERGSVPNAMTLIAIAKGLGVHVISLLRVIEGKPLSSDTSTVLMNLFADMSDTARDMVMEWLLMPEDQRRAVEAGLGAVLASHRPRPEQP